MQQQKEKEYITITIPKGGRPPKEYKPGYLATLLLQRTQMTVPQMAQFYGVSLSTMHRQLRIAKKEVNSANDK